ncbi:MAG: hypothetical protein ABI409_03060, partial [Ramlibacter sp.]
RGINHHEADQRKQKGRPATPGDRKARSPSSAVGRFRQRGTSRWVQATKIAPPKTMKVAVASLGKKTLTIADWALVHDIANRPEASMTKVKGQVRCVGPDSQSCIEPEIAESSRFDSANCCLILGIGRCEACRLASMSSPRNS